ncbi:hypothetical protein RHDC4_01577 [Rhodocyclaceae bacterium]|nr:hypothetical protein RHDC4_01577 [Rhodocyclaceae bacterium]
MADDSAGWWARSHKPTVFAGIALLISVFAIVVVVVASGKIDLSWLTAKSKDSRPAEVQLQPYAAAARKPPPTPDWPTSPSYQKWHSGKSIAPLAPARNAQGNRSDEAPEIQEPPLPRGDFIAAAEAGQKVYVPNPKGQCKLTGVSGSALIQALDDCFTSPGK